MEHVVFFTGADGAAHYRRASSLDDVVRAVEHLRNVEGVEDARVFALTEVPLSFKAVYRVEIGGEPAPEPAPQPDPEPVTEPVAEVAEVVAEPEPVAVPAEPFATEVYTPQPETAGNGKSGARGLGFFSR